MERVVRQRHEEVFGETNPLEPKCFFGDLGLKGLAKSFAGVYTVVLVTDVETLTYNDLLDITSRRNIRLGFQWAVIAARVTVTGA